MIGVGDLVVCVDGSPCRMKPYPGAPFGISEGATLRVEALQADPDDGALLLDFGDSYNFVYHADRFRKILPDKHEACEDEFAILLKLSKQRVKA